MKDNSNSNSIITASAAIQYVYRYVYIHVGKCTMFFPLNDVVKRRFPSSLISYDLNDSHDSDDSDDSNDSDDSDYADLPDLIPYDSDDDMEPNVKPRTQ